MELFLDSLKWGKDGLITVIVQHADTGEVLMQAYADRAALSETLQTRLATFYSRSRKERWCKGETSGNFIKVLKVFADCDKDSLIYLSDPIGPSCHTGARTCWFSEVEGPGAGGAPVALTGRHDCASHAPATTLLALESTIQQRSKELDNPIPGAKPSWTVKLLSNPKLLVSKVREEADELCRTLEGNEGKERCASEMADLLYHAMVLLNKQGVSLEEVLQVTRQRFGTSGIDEKAARAPKKE